jgi:di/tricarboxylate transporter
MLLVISIPYLILGAYFDMVKLKTERQFKIRKMLYGQKAILIILIIVIGFWIFRNILDF